jgi:DNA excision repair protein ERCC-4
MTETGSILPHNGNDIIVRAESSLKEFAKALENKGFVVQVSLAPVDFVIWTNDKPILAERKTTNDFVRSIQDGSLFEQAKVMSEISPNRFFLLEDYSWRDFFQFTFKSGGGRVKMSPNSIVGSMDAVERKLGVPVISTLSKKGTLYWLTKVLEETKGIRKYHPSALRASASRKLSLEEQAEYIVQGFPGMGPSTSREVRKAYDSLDDFLDSLFCAKDDRLPSRVFNLLPKWKEILTVNWKIKGDKE